MNHYKYMREGEDEYGIKELQDKILEIAVYIDEFCKTYGIVYYLMGGSALGAVRHKGFIPWDDDLDIFMDYDNYVKFYECCDKYLDKEKYYLQKENSWEQPYFFSKLRMNNTFCDDGIITVNGAHKGIFVDIMCLNNASPTLIGKKIQYYAAGMLKAETITHTNYVGNTLKKKVELLISGIIVKGPIKRVLLKIVRQYNVRETKEVTHLFGRAKFKNSFYLKSDFSTPIRAPFEKVTLNIPNGVDNYLRQRYGDRYMDIPDEKTKAIYSSHALRWSVE